MPADDSKPEGELIRRPADPLPATWARRQVDVLRTQLGQFRYLAADVRKAGRWLASALSGRRGA